MSGCDIEVITWTAPSSGRESHADVEVALKHLGGATPADISLARSDGTWMFGGGHDGRFVVVYAAGDEHSWHAETSALLNEPLPLLVVGGQGAEHPAEYRLDAAELRLAVTWFAELGGMCPQVKWVQDY